MTASLTILGMSGSLRKWSINRAVLLAAQELVPEGVTLTVAEIRRIPLYNYDLEKAAFPEPVAVLKAQIRAANAVLIVTPEYQYSVPGVLKNVLDWISRPPGDVSLANKPVGIMGASPGRIGTARAQMHLREMLLHDRALVLPAPQVMIAEARRKLDEAGRLVDEETRQRIRTFLEALVAWARKVG